MLETIISVGVGLLIAAFYLIAFGIVLLGIWFLACLNTSHVAWADADMRGIRARAEQRVPPPPASSFAGATMTRYGGIDTWKCIRYKTEASADDIRVYYEDRFREMQWGIEEGIKQDGRSIWKLAVTRIDGTVELTPWAEWMFADAVQPPYRVTFCFVNEFWLKPKVAATSTVTVYWPDPEVVAWREKVEQAFPPDPSWTFSSATMITRPNGYHWDCMTYKTGLSEADGRAYYQKWLPGPAHLRSAGPPYLVKARIQATDGEVTICPYFDW